MKVRFRHRKHAEERHGSSRLLIYNVLEFMLPSMRLADVRYQKIRSKFPFNFNDVAR